MRTQQYRNTLVDIDAGLRTWIAERTNARTMDEWETATQHIDALLDQRRELTEQGAG